MASGSDPPQKSKFASFLASQEPLEIFDRICSFLSTADFMVFRQVCKRYYQVENLHRIFNINKLLRPFVRNPPAFRSKLGEYDALISGVFALNFFELGSSDVSVLDIFVNGAKDEIAAYIKDEEGYGKEERLENTMGAARFRFSKSKQSGKTIRLTATGGIAIETILRHSYTTSSINFITWNKAYSIFPTQTLIYHKFYALKLLDNNFGSFLKEQSNQGWTNRDMVWPDLTKEARHRIDGYRRVGDKSSLMIPLNVEDVLKASTPDSTIEFAQFEVFTEPETPLFGARPTERHGSPQIRVDGLMSFALRHGYTVAGSPWYKFFMEKLQRWVWLELWKLKTDERPEQYANGPPGHSEISLPSDFQPPETWDYADDQIPVWYREWEHAQAHTYGQTQNRRFRRS